MTKYLLDTHTLLWILSNPNLLPPSVLDLFKDANNIFFVHKISFWEISIKNSIGKLPLSTSIQELYDKTVDSGIEIMDLDIESIKIVNQLPLHHRDPFDRMLIAQAILEQIPVISIDGKFDLYENVVRVW